MVCYDNNRQKRPSKTAIRKGRYVMMKDIETIIIDYSQLMDLRIDFAFKTFADGNLEAVTSLLNAIFANQKSTAL